MKTNTNTKSGAREQIRTVEQSKPEAQSPEAQKQNNRLPIDREQRKKNRTLETPKVLNLLLTQLPDVYRVAEVVGKWVWVRFTEEPTVETRQQLAQLGFHWNRQRKAWQHPCGQYRLSSQADPHEKYSSYLPSRIRRNKPQTTAAPNAE